MKPVRCVRVGETELKMVKGLKNPKETRWVRLAG